MVDNVDIIKTAQVFDTLPRRQETAAKWDVGRALLCCGSYGMAGAAIIAARGCIDSGVGLCEIVCPKSVYPIIAPAVPEAVFTPVSDDALTAMELDKIRKSVRRADCVLLGCGCGSSEYTARLLCLLLECCEKTLIIDADGLNMLGQSIYLLGQPRRCEVIITPHIVEMSRLIGKSADYVEQNRLTAADEFAQKQGVCVVLKGHNTAVVPSGGGRALLNRGGNAGMATAGCGDLLAGIMASLSAQGMGAVDAAAAAVHIHALAGDLCAAEYSQHATTPTRMLEQLPEIFLQAERRSID